MHANTQTVLQLGGGGGWGLKIANSLQPSPQVPESYLSFHDL